MKCLQSKIIVCRYATPSPLGRRRPGLQKSLPFWRPARSAEVSPIGGRPGLLKSVRLGRRRKRQLAYPQPLTKIPAGQVQHNFADLAENIPPEVAESETGTKCGDSMPKVPRKHETGTKCRDSVPVFVPVSVAICRRGGTELVPHWPKG